MMEPYQKEFIKFSLAHNVLRFGEFKLKSGRISPYFFNAGLFNTGHAIAKLGQYYARAIIDSDFSFDTLFGPAYKGIPLVTSTAMALSELFHRDRPFCFNRKEIKDHGEGGNIVGAKLTGNVLVIDDVITAGTAVNESVNIIRANGAKFMGVCVAMDREERGQTEKSAIQEIEEHYQSKVISIIKLKHILEYLSEKKELKEALEQLYIYRETYGIDISS